MDLYNILSINGINLSKIADTTYETVPEFFITATSSGDEGSTTNFDSRTSTKININTNSLRSGSTATNLRFYITFYKNEYNKIVGLTYIAVPSNVTLTLPYYTPSGTTGNHTFYELCHIEQTSLPINNIDLNFQKKNDESKIFDANAQLPNDKWNYFTVMFNEYYSDNILNELVDAEFKDHVIAYARNYIYAIDSLEYTDLYINDYPKKSDWLNSKVSEVLKNYNRDEYINMSGFNNYLQTFNKTICYYNDDKILSKHLYYDLNNTLSFNTKVADYLILNYPRLISSYSFNISSLNINAGTIDLCDFSCTCVTLNAYSLGTVNIYGTKLMALPSTRYNNLTANIRIIKSCTFNYLSVCNITAQTIYINTYNNIPKLYINDDYFASCSLYNIDHLYLDCHYNASNTYSNIDNLCVNINNIFAHNMLSSIYNLILNVYSCSSNTFDSIRLLNLTCLILNNNTFSHNNILNLTCNYISNNVFSYISSININVGTLENMTLINDKTNDTYRSFIKINALYINNCSFESLHYIYFDNCLTVSKCTFNMISTISGYMYSDTSNTFSNIIIFTMRIYDQYECSFSKISHFTLLYAWQTRNTFTGVSNSSFIQQN